jgi:galactoside O-acetyltransferase
LSVNDDSGCIVGEDSVLSARVYQADREKGAVIVGRECVINGLLVIERASAVLRIADNVFVNHFTIFDCATSITVEDDVLIAYHCFISDTNNHSLAYSTRKHDLRKARDGAPDWTPVKSAPVHIGRGAWIGAYSIIQKGVRVGVGSIVAAGSVVTKDVPDWTMVGGNPAKVIRELREDER